MDVVSHHTEYIFRELSYDTSGGLNARGHFYIMYASKGRESGKEIAMTMP